MKKNRKWWSVGVFIFMLFAVDIIVSYFIPHRGMENTSTIPEPDPNRETYLYDFYKDKWVYKDELSDGTKGLKETRKSQGLTEEDLQEYLEEHIDDYKEDTYWGEEWDSNNN